MNETAPHGPVVPTDEALASLRPLPAGGAVLDPDGLLGAWQARNAAATLPHCVKQLDEHGNLTNLLRVTGEAGGDFAGMWFADSDVYKTLEAVLWEVARSGESSAFVADTAALLAKAQDPDGYLNSFYQADHRDLQWAELGRSHEMYCAGHLIQAAVAAARSTGSGPATQDVGSGPTTRNAGHDAAARQVVAVARRFADLLVRRYGPGGDDAVCGHPEIETALVELYRVTGHRPYLDLAARLVDLRGRGLLGPCHFGSQYFQDHRPVREADQVAGHVVRQLYLLAGAVDVAVEHRDADLLGAAERLWDSAIDSRTYLTGGQGSRHRDEAFGDPYELPPDRAYAETCAAIGSFQLAWRLLLATGRSRYADEMERLLYNGIAASIGLDGSSFFYSNPLQLRTGHDGTDDDAPSRRPAWHSCACCPPNLARLMASLHTYLATGTDRGIELHLYAGGAFGCHGNGVEVTTRYPWDETVTIAVTEATGGSWTLALRVPAWCDDARLSVNGAPVKARPEEGYLRLTRQWRVGDRIDLMLAMPARLTSAHPRVDALRGTAALTRGPLVYCLEHADLPEVLACDVFEDLELDPRIPVGVVSIDGAIAPVTLTATIRVRPDAAGTALYRPLATAQTRSSAQTSTAVVGVPAIPYFLWANRAPGPMRVWIPLAPAVRDAV